MSDNVLVLMVANDDDGKGSVVWIMLKQINAKTERIHNINGIVDADLDLEWFVSFGFETFCS
eukprot:scaffold26595_cov63-Attheya_sp.AAC.4